MDNYYDNNEFDINEFNQNFEKIQQDKKKKKELENDNYIKSLDSIEEKEKKIMDMNIIEIFTNTKYEILDLVYEIISFNYATLQEFLNLFTKKNRLFYIGLFLLLISGILYLISFIFFYPSNTQKNDININIPNDYSFKYLPHNPVTNDQGKKIKELEDTIETLKLREVPNPRAQPNANTSMNI
jgi:hypothetical protein